MSSTYRIEQDSMGEIEVPNENYYGAQTRRAMQHFACCDLIPWEFIRSYAIVKKAAAQANCELKVLDPELAKLIIKASEEIIAGKFRGDFPLPIWQSGSGTQTNMNVNEVIANRANELAGMPLGSKDPVHPNDHVNMSQSTNDSFPTAMHITAVLKINLEFLPALEKLKHELNKKEKEFQGIMKVGRTHLMDAVPLELAQEFSGYVSLIDRNINRWNLVIEGLYDLALGGTAVGNGLNAPQGFSELAISKIAELTRHPFRPHPNKFAAISAHDEMVFASGALKTTACSLIKIANDIRWLASGPRCGLGELNLLGNEPGSSIMPGKVNPTQCEALIMAANQVISHDVAIGLAGAQGNFELNTFKPAILYNFIHSLTLLTETVSKFIEHCIIGLTPNLGKLKQNIDNSLMQVTQLTPVIGYDKAAKIAKLALEKNLTLREACLDLGYLTMVEFDKLMNL